MFEDRLLQTLQVNEEHGKHQREGHKEDDDLKLEMEVYSNNMLSGYILSVQV